jgi:hypothetical protein
VFNSFWLHGLKESTPENPSIWIFPSLNEKELWVYSIVSKTPSCLMQAAVVSDGFVKFSESGSPTK